MKLLILQIIIFLNIVNLLSAQKLRSQFKKICGQRTHAVGRIVGGKNADLGEYPWFARIGIQANRRTEFFCAGSLFTNRHILTAEHCLYDVVKYKLRNRMVVTLGDHNEKGSKSCVGKLCSPSSESFRVSKLITYRMNESTFKNDIAILELATKVVFNRWKVPVCLPDNISPTKLIGNAVEVIGFGLINSYTKKTAKILQKITITIKPIKDCEMFEEPPGAGQICAGGVSKDSCDGDSGGPLTKLITENNQSRHTQLGIVSFGAEICENNNPAVYTDVNYFLKWIDSQVDK